MFPVTDFSMIYITISRYMAIIITKILKILYSPIEEIASTSQICRKSIVSCLAHRLVTIIGYCKRIILLNLKMCFLLNSKQCKFKETSKCDRKSCM